MLLKTGISSDTVPHAIVGIGNVHLFKTITPLSILFRITLLWVAVFCTRFQKQPVKSSGINYTHFGICGG